MSDINQETNTGTCSVCGPDSKIKKSYGKDAGRYRCYRKYREDDRFRGDNTKVTIEQELHIKTRNGGMCDICKINPATELDHCHEKKVVRGFLCRSCNIGLGNFQDSIMLLNEAAEYLSAFVDDV